MTNPLPPIEKQIVVPWDPKTAFERFTAHMGQWWPLRSHSVEGRSAATVVFDARPGGKIEEVGRNGARHTWGTVLESAPPHALTFTWHPGRSSHEATQVQLRFVPDARGTRVELRHSGWEALGQSAATARRAYPLGWAYVLRIYAGRTRGPFILTMDALELLLRPVAKLLRKRAA